MLYPLTFAPIFKERVWGGRELARLYGKALPEGVPIGESWELTDRPEGVSQITNGPLAGKDLRWLMEQHAAELLGESPSQGGKFPLLVKILDAREKLSLQVHPPAALAASMGGEPKTEMWYVADATPDADLFVGLKPGVTREEFTRKTHDGTVAECFYRHAVKRGDAMFLPSGRVHALGGGNLIFEIQQNSDTTYRVFDWNRKGLDGKPRELHIEQSLKCIDFQDFAPALIQPRAVQIGNVTAQLLVADALFQVSKVALSDQQTMTVTGRKRFELAAALAGELRIESTGVTVRLQPGQFCLLPACLSEVRVTATGATEFLWVQGGR